MVKLALIFLMIASIAGFFAFTDIAVAVPGIARIIFLTFLVLFLITVVGWLLIRRKEQNHTP